MALSAVMIGAVPGKMAEVQSAVDAFPWAEVHHDDTFGRLIVVIDSASTEASVERLKVLKELPGVAAAEMVMHCFEEEAESGPMPDAKEAIAYLNDDSAPLRSSPYRKFKSLSGL